MLFSDFGHNQIHVIKFLRVEFTPQSFRERLFSWLRLFEVCALMSQSDVTFLRNEAWIHNPRDPGQRASPNTYEVLSGKDISRRPQSNSKSFLWPFCGDSDLRAIANSRSAHSVASDAIGLTCWRWMRRFRQYQTSWCYCIYIYAKL